MHLIVPTAIWRAAAELQSLPPSPIVATQRAPSSHPNRRERTAFSCEEMEINKKKLEMAGSTIEIRASPKILACMPTACDFDNMCKSECVATNAMFACHDANQMMKKGWGDVFWVKQLRLKKTGLILFRHLLSEHRASGGTG